MRILSVLLACVLALGLMPAAKPEGTINQAINEWQAQHGPNWWLWGLQAIDYDGDGDDDFVLTQHHTGHSRILQSNNGTWSWANITSNLGGTFRPMVWDFNKDGREDLAFRDDQPNTFFLNGGADFANLGFQYSTGNYPIRDIKDFNGDGFLDFGHDWGRWHWNGGGFTKVNYTNPMYGLLPLDVKQWLDGEFAKNSIFFRAYFHEADLNNDGFKDVILVGFWTYHKGPMVTRFLLNRRNQRLVDVTAALNLPGNGAVNFVADMNGDGKSDFLMVGFGQYLSSPAGYQFIAGDLSTFLQNVQDYMHQVHVSGNKIVVCNMRGQLTKIYQVAANGGCTLLNSVGSWDAEPVAIGDFNGDGVEDIAIGTGNDIYIKWG